jgi:hypothetical protein
VTSRAAVDTAKRRFSVPFTLTAGEAAACDFGADVEASPAPTRRGASGA